MRKSIVMAVALFLLVANSGWTQTMREATKVVIGQTIHFTLDKDEQRDFAVQFGAGPYYMVWDENRTAEGGIMADVQLLKTNGTLVDPSFLPVSNNERSIRVGRKFQASRPMAARIRVRNTWSPIEVWMTIVPAAKMQWMPFAFYHEELKPLGIGPTEGKGGTLSAHESVYHAIKLPSGTWTISLYLKNPSGGGSTLMGRLDQFDQYGFLSQVNLVTINQVAAESRQEQKIYLAHPQTVMFRVTNQDNHPVEYTVGIEK